MFDSTLSPGSAASQATQPSCDQQRVCEMTLCAPAIDAWGSRKRSASGCTLFLLALLCLPLLSANAQQEVFNVPSADVLDRGKAYLEWDASVGDSTVSAAFTPRSVYGVGRGVEVGINVPSFSLPDAGMVAVVPVVKWKFYESRDHGVVLFSGVHLTLPYQHSSWRAGTYTYVEAAKLFRTGTRIGAGLYDCSAHVVEQGNRAGIQASVEQTVNPRLMVAADWYSGSSSIGFLTPGVAYKVSPAFTLFTAYELGNRDAMHGNHAVLLELGWNPEWGRLARFVR